MLHLAAINGNVDTLAVILELAPIEVVQRLLCAHLIGVAVARSPGL